MSTEPSVLNRVSVASPCPTSWDAMVGNDQVRHCGQCRLNVYNLSAMTRPEAEALFLKKEGRLCVRFYQRADGTMITQDCPVGLAKLKKKLARLAGGLAAAIAFAAGLGGCGRDEEKSPVAPPPVKTKPVVTQPAKPQPQKQDPQPMMGAPMPMPEAKMGDAVAQPPKTETGTEQKAPEKK